MFCPKTSASFPSALKKLTMDFRTAVKTLILHLPKRLEIYWLDLDLLHDAVKCGGFPVIKKKDIEKIKCSCLVSPPKLFLDHGGDTPTAIT